MNHSIPVYRPFGPWLFLESVTTRSRTCLLTSGASRLVCLPNRSKHKVPNHFETSLEEAAVSRPGREAGMKNGQTLRAPKVRHRNHACHDFFTASLTRRGASETSEVAAGSGLTDRTYISPLGGKSGNGWRLWKTRMPRSHHRATYRVRRLYFLSNLRSRSCGKAIAL